MKNLVSRTTCYSIFLLWLLVWGATGRSLQYNAGEEVSDGVHKHEASSFLRLEGTNGHCKQMYGFLPCSSNLAGHLFLIVVYEYLLYHGESYAGGDGRIFGVLGNNFFGASVFQLLDSLPDSLILLVSGLSSSKEKAQYYVVTGAGLLAGSSVLFLTVLWGICFICGRTKFYVKPGSKVKNKVTQLLSGSGVVTDAETSYHAKFMFFSLIPFVVMLLPSVFGLSYSSQGYRIVILVSLCIAVICLFSYFIYQLFDGRIQKRRLEYAEVERKVELQVPFYEVQALMLERDKHLMIRTKEMEKMMKYPNGHVNKTMTKDEFYKTFEDWLNVTKQLIDDPYSLDNLGTKYNQVAELLLEDKNKMIELISLMMERASGQKLLKEDGAQDESAIDKFYESIDTNHDGFITRNELKNFIMAVNYDEILIDDEITEIIMRYLDIDGNGDIDKQEFKSAVKKWLKEMDRVVSRKKQKHSQNRDQERDKYHRAEAKVKAEEKFKAIVLLIIGVFMLTVLAEPLVESVREFSESIMVEPFYVSFILVPLATNVRTAIAAIRAASQKRHQTTSLTFSEVAELLLEDKNKLIELISLMMERASGQKLLKADGARDDSAIDKFYERIDTNRDGFITRNELKNFIMEVNYDEILMDDEIAEIIMRHLDIDGNGDIDKQEFKSGVKKWLKEMDHVVSRNKQKNSQNRDQERDKYQRAEAKAKADEKFKAVVLLMVGIFMLTVLAEPLVESVREFSESIMIKPFYVSFILVPLATNARTAIAAIRAASQKRHQTTSLTFSEIYHKVFMNNIQGFCVLVSVIYFRGLTWHFSAEILVVIIVCITMGLLASFRSKFPNWTLFIAFLLYPLSLVVVYILDDTFRFT